MRFIRKKWKFMLNTKCYSHAILISLLLFVPSTCLAQNFFWTCLRTFGLFHGQEGPLSEAKSAGDKFLDNKAGSRFEATMENNGNPIKVEFRVYHGTQGRHIMLYADVPEDQVTTFAFSLLEPFLRASGVKSPRLYEFSPGKYTANGWEIGFAYDYLERRMRMKIYRHRGYGEEPESIQLMDHFLASGVQLSPIP